jgi:hypothetical protein
MVMQPGDTTTSGNTHMILLFFRRIAFSTGAFKRSFWTLRRHMLMQQHFLSDCFSATTQGAVTVTVFSEVHP